MDELYHPSSVPLDDRKFKVLADTLEWQKRGVLHYHALLSNVGDLRRQMAQQLWYKQHNSYAKIDIAGGDAVINYVSKYVVKGGQIDVSPWLRDATKDLW